MEEGRWSKQSYNQNELRRVHYIKQKKEMQRQEQLIRETERLANFQMEDAAEEDNKRSKKRVLKSNKSDIKDSSPDDHDLNTKSGKKKNVKNKK